MKYCEFCPRGNHECYGFKDDSSKSIQLSVEKAENDLLTVLKRLYIENYDLVMRNVNERCITNYIFHYFLDEKADDYPNYQIDAEYNKNGDRKKVYDNNDSYAIPDLLIHRRFCNRENLLCVEFKKDKLKDEDRNKLIKFTKLHNASPRRSTDLEYFLGCGVILHKLEISFCWYKNGEEIQKNKYFFEQQQEEFVKQE